MARLATLRDHAPVADRIDDDTKNALIAAVYRDIRKRL